MRPDLLLICAALPAFAGVVVGLVRRQNAVRGMKTRILRELIGLETLWEDAANRSRA
jgi:hypothetical protein